MVLEYISSLCRYGFEFYLFASFRLQRLEVSILPGLQATALRNSVKSLTTLALKPYFNFFLN